MKKTRHRKGVVIALLTGLFLCVSAAAAAVPSVVMDARDSVVRVLVLDENGEMEGHGTGFTVDKNSRYVITNYHVAGEATALIVRVDDETEIEAVLIAGVPEKDLAVIQMKEPLRAPGIPLRRAKFEAGLASYALGYPFATDQINQSYRTGKAEITVTDGIVGGVHDTPILSGGTTDCKVVQSTTTINPGNSGGPLLDENGNLIGINTFHLTTAQNTYGAVHIDELRRVLDRENLPYREGGAGALWIFVAAGGVLLVAAGAFFVLRHKRRAKVQTALAASFGQEQLTLPLAETEELTPSAAMPAPKKKWMTKKRWIALASAVVLLAAGGGLLTYARQMDAQLEDHLRAGDFELALADIQRMPWAGFGAQETQYLEALSLLQSGELEQAVAALEELGDYEKSKELTWRLKRYLSAGQITDPVKQFDLFCSMEGFLDSEQKAQEAAEGVLEVALDSYYAQDFFEAIPLFWSIEAYDEDAAVYGLICEAGQTLARAGLGADITITEIDDAVDLLREAEELGYPVEPACMDPVGIYSFLNGNWRTADGEKFMADLSNEEFDFSMASFPGGDYYFGSQGIEKKDGTQVVRWRYESVDRISMKVNDRNHLFTRENVPKKAAEAEVS